VCEQSWRSSVIALIWKGSNMRVQQGLICQWVGWWCGSLRGVGVLPSKQLTECRQLLWMIMMLQQHEQPFEAGVKGLLG
jgi:hypothetical protein